MLKTCPKCGYVRSPRDEAPDWQCPACGIAYYKYESYLERAKGVAQPRSTGQRKESLRSDGSLFALIVTNVFVLLLALTMGWRLIDMMLVYWIQSVVIGVANFYRMLNLEEFSTENFTMNNRPVDPTPETKRQVAGFFALHFGTFHVVYFVFMMTGEFGDPRLGMDLLICGAAFAMNHWYSYQYHLKSDRSGTPNIGTLMFTPYARVVPMHLTIIFGAAIGQGGIFLFGFLKTIADGVMHQIEHHTLSKAD
ncbi:MAG: hypothetical protein JJ934_18395 [Pseudomonadales bacterium]|nr:hypothetical protein [Pseudomonadales bacterium]MBO6701335.1 hypothetical protein [Pseudomonadales bacterium]MBO7006813.1 hypothetical protein [Pseudomonadales bacterium]